MCIPVADVKGRSGWVIAKVGDKLVVCDSGGVRGDFDLDTAGFVKQKDGSWRISGSGMSEPLTVEETDGLFSKTANEIWGRQQVEHMEKREREIAERDEEDKAELLAMAKRGDPAPSPESRLGRQLRRFTTPN